MQPESLARELEKFLAEARSAVVLEEGAPLFDLATARYSVSGERGRCLLHLWSAERNAVRRVLGAERRPGRLRLSVQRFGQKRPARLEVVLDRDPRAASARRAARAAYRKLLERLLADRHAGWKLERFTSAMDLERSFGPVHARGLLRRGTSALAVVGCNAGETQAAVEASVAVGILWLDHCRQQLAARAHVEALHLFVPPGRAETVRQRLAHLNREAARFQLFELDEPQAAMTEVDCADRGNLATRLVHCPDAAAAGECFAAAIARVRASAPEAEVAVLSGAEVAFRMHGLEFARARLGAQAGGFRPGQEIVFGLGAAETALTDENAAQFEELVERMAAARQPAGDRRHPLWRMHPERWLESLVACDVEALDPGLDPACVYSQVPAFASTDRAMIDVLGVTRGGRLAVIELKADEDLQLPIQGLDYWARVAWHHERGEFHRFGYYGGRELSPAPPLLYLVAPALHVHPATDTLLRYMAPEIECTLVGVHESWREGVRVIFRKRRTSAAGG